MDTTALEVLKTEKVACERRIANLQRDLEMYQQQVADTEEALSKCEELLGNLCAAIETLGGNEDESDE